VGFSLGIFQNSKSVGPVPMRQFSAVKPVSRQQQGQQQNPTQNESNTNPTPACP